MKQLGSAALHRMSRAGTVMGVVLLLGNGIAAASAPPAAPEERHHAALDAEADGRLAKETAVLTRRKALGDALRSLAEQTGVRLEASREVAELKVTLLARDLPLGRLLAEIAELLDLSWSRSGSAPGYRYVCARDLEATARARAALEQSRAAHAKSVRAQLERMVEALQSGHLGMLKETDPILARDLEGLFRWMDRKALRAFGDTITRILPELVQNSNVTLPYRELPRSLQETIRSSAAGALPLALGQVRGPDGNSPGYEESLQAAHFRMALRGMDYGDSRYVMELSIPGLPPSTTLRMQSYPGPPEFIPATASPGATPAPRAAPADRGMAPGGAAASERAPLTPVRRRLSNTARPRKEGMSNMSGSDVAERLAANTPLAVVSDYYATGYDRPRALVPPQPTPEAVLAAMEEFLEIGYTIAKDRRVVRLRSRTWMFDDLIEPPDGVISALETSFRTKGRFSLADYLLAARLTRAQQFGLARVDLAKFEVLRRTLHDDTDGLLGEFLRLTAALSASQRTTAMSASGMPATQLGGPEQSLLLEIATRRFSNLTPREAASAVFRVGREGRGGE